jgi:hypothetical protein
MVDKVEAVMDAAIKAARAKAQEKGLVEKGGDLKVVVNVAYRSPAHRRWLGFGSKIPRPIPVMIRESLRRSAEEAEGG